MSWQVKFHPLVESDVTAAAEWYDGLKSGLGDEFTEEVIREWEKLAQNPYLRSRRHPRKNIRWRFTDRFPYRVIYEVVESKRVVIVTGILHAARDHRHWQNRL